MKRRIKLKNWVKEVLIMFAFVGIITGAIYAYIHRIEKIESGQMILLNHNGGDR